MTYEEILQGMLDKVPSNVDKREGSIIYDALAPCAYFLAQQNFQLENFLNLVFPDTALAEYLDRAIAGYGVVRKSATAAVRQMITSGAVELGTRWGISTLVYVVTEQESENSYLVECETPGEIGNQYSGTMHAVSNVTGITATLGEIITPGTDEETDEALRERFYQKVRLPATSGNAYHYKLWALEVPGVGDAKVFPLDNGPGTVTVLIIDSDKEINETLEDAVSAYIESVRPIGATVTVSSPEATEINVTADILLDGTRTAEQIQKDFGTLLDSYLRELVFQTYRVSFAQIGSLLLSTDGVQDYEGLTVNGAAGNIIINEKAMPVLGTVNLTEVSALAAD